MMRKTLGWVALLAMIALPVWAHSEHEHGAATEASGAATAQAGAQSLTGEVVDVFCYLSHGQDGLGAKHAGCAKKCIKGGLPVAIKVGGQLYLASMADHTAANETFADLASQQVTVHGTIMERDGQRLISVTHVEKAQ